MDPLKELVKKSVLGLLEEGNWPAAKQKYADLISKVKDRTELDLWFDEQVRRYVAPVMMKEKRYEEVMAIYEQQQVRNKPNPYEHFEHEWKLILNIKPPEGERLEALGRRTNFFLGTGFLIMIVGGVIKLAGGNLTVLMIGALIFFIGIFVSADRDEEALRQKQQKEDPIRREYERRKRTGENR